MWWRKAQMDEAFFLAEDLMSMHGNLYKKGRNLVKKYKKRWFVLPDNSLLIQYFTAPQGKLLGEIDINNIYEVKALKNNKKHLYGLQITAAKTITLYARTIEERDGWCTCLAHRLRMIAHNKLSIREAPGQMQDEEDRNCQTLPKANNGHRHSNSHNRDHRDSPRRALSDSSLGSNNSRLARFTPPFNDNMLRSTPPQEPKKLKYEVSMDVTGNSPIITEDLRSNASSIPSFRARSPIAISDETNRFNVHDPHTVVHNNTFEDDTPSIVNSPEGSASLDDHLANQNAQLQTKLCRMEHVVAEKDATIAALNAMLKRQSLAPDLARFNGANGANAQSSVGKNRVQQHLDEYVGISMWLEQRKKSELEKDVQQLKEANEELGNLLEEERQKTQFLEREKYNMACMIEHLEREKIKT